MNISEKGKWGICALICISLIVCFVFGGFYVLEKHKNSAVERAMSVIDKGNEMSGVALEAEDMDRQINFMTIHSQSFWCASMENHDTFVGKDCKREGAEIYFDEIKFPHTSILFITTNNR